MNKIETLNENALEAAVLAHDKEEAAIRGEPDPWADERPEDEFSDRKAAMAEAIRAYLTASEREREPVAWASPDSIALVCGEKIECSVFLTYMPHDEYTMALYAAPLPITALEAENARLRERLAEALKALDETDRILRDIERHETTRVVDAQDRISIARRVREGGKVE